MNHSSGTKPVPNRTVSDSVMIALRKIIQAIDMNSKNLIKRVGLTGPAACRLAGSFQPWRSHRRRNRAGGQSQSGDRNRYSGANGKPRTTRTATQRSQQATGFGAHHRIRQTGSGKGPPSDVGGIRRTFFQLSRVGADHDFEFPAAPGLHPGSQRNSRPFACPLTTTKALGARVIFDQRLNMTLFLLYLSCLFSAFQTNCSCKSEQWVMCP